MSLNHLAHLWLTDQARLPLAGAVLGDLVRGRLEGRLPTALEASIRLHRRIDAVTDSHPLVIAERARFATGARRYAGIVLDLVHDHCLAQDWSCYSEEPLAVYAGRAAAEVVAEQAGFALAGMSAPSAARFCQALLSYAEPDGIDRALRHIGARMRQPRALLDAASGWQAHVAAVRANLPGLLNDLAVVARSFRTP